MQKILFFSFLYSLSISCFCQSALGIDVSMWQNTVNWQDVLSDDKVYAWAKATEGKTGLDPQFSNNITNGINAGVIMGAYHFARPDNNTAVEDATNFLNVAGNYIGNGFLPPALDLENPYNNGQVVVLTNLFSSAQLTDWAQSWMTTVENQTGVAPIIYCNGNYAGYVNSSLNIYGLWFAQPNGDTLPPTNIGNWNNWLFKQYSWTGSVAGINGDVDLNVFNGTKADLNNLIGINSSKTPSLVEERKIKLFPNPVEKTLHIVNNNPFEIEQIIIKSSQGKSIKLILNPTNFIDLSDLSSSIYFAEILLKNNTTFIKKIIKK